MAPAIMHAEPGHETDAGQDRATAGGAAQVGTAEGGGELRVLLHEGAFHLLQRSQLFLGERHGNLLSRDDAFTASVSSHIGIR